MSNERKKSEPKVYDFTHAVGERRAAPPPGVPVEDGRVADGWRAYRRWLDMLREDFTGNDAPPDPRAGDSG